MSGANAGHRLAPFSACSSYPGHRDHLAAANLASAVASSGTDNQWNSPIVIVAGIHQREEQNDQKQQPTFENHRSLGHGVMQVITHYEGTERYRCCSLLWISD